MSEENKNNKDIHGTPATTRWVHKHRTLAKFIMKGLAIGATSALYYLRKQEDKIKEEEKRKNH